MPIVEVRCPHCGKTQEINPARLMGQARAKTMTRDERVKGGLARHGRPVAGTQPWSALKQKVPPARRQVLDAAVAVEAIRSLQAHSPQCRCTLCRLGRP